MSDAWKTPKLFVIRHQFGVLRAAAVALASGSRLGVAASGHGERPADLAHLLRGQVADVTD